MKSLQCPGGMSPHKFGLEVDHCKPIWPYEAQFLIRFCPFWAHPDKDMVLDAQGPSREPTLVPQELLGLHYCQEAH